MKVCNTIDGVRSQLVPLRRQGTVGFVPTMGALHEGHMSLVRAAQAQCDTVAVSIFVNPTQFGPNEDYSRYPRSLGQDRELLEKEAVDLLFAPSVEEIYPIGSATYVTVEGMSEKLCGGLRPGHFRGVTTVIAKLFNIIMPDRVFFGQKDGAQVAIVKRMVRDLHIPVEIAVCPIVREPDGLAMSSRNAYLDVRQRKRALVLYRSLMTVQRLFDQGERNAARLITAGKAMFAQEPSARLDYFQIVHSSTLDSVASVSGDELVAVAAFVGGTRLIDNIILEPTRQPHGG